MEYENRNSASSFQRYITRLGSSPQLVIFGCVQSLRFENWVRFDYDQEFGKSHNNNDANAVWYSQRLRRETRPTSVCLVLKCVTLIQKLTCKLHYDVLAHGRAHRFGKPIALYSKSKIKQIVECNVCAKLWDLATKYVSLLSSAYFSCFCHRQDSNQCRLRWIRWHNKWRHLSGGHDRALPQGRLLGLVCRQRAIYVKPAVLNKKYISRGKIISCELSGIIGERW